MKNISPSMKKYFIIYEEYFIFEKKIFHLFKNLAHQEERKRPKKEVLILPPFHSSDFHHLSFFSLILIL